MLLLKLPSRELQGCQEKKLEERGTGDSMTHFYQLALKTAVTLIPQQYKNIVQ